jgi:hypothetical protein
VPITLAVAGLVVACLASIAIGAPPTVQRGPRAAQDFVDAWHRSQTATYVVDAAVTRTLPNGQQINWEQHEVRRPPERLMVGLGTVEGRLGDHLVRCASDPSGNSRCTQSAPDDTFADEVAADTAELRRELIDDSLYTVVDFGEDHGTHCYRLDLAKQFPSPPYGTSALFCFDVATGAPVLTVVEQPESTTRTVASRPIRGDVTDADLVVPPDRGSVVGVAGG